MKLDDVWERKVAEFNACHPNHPPLMIRWEPRAVWVERIVWGCGVPVFRNKYEPRWQVGVVLPNKAKGPVTYLEGSGGLWFFKLFNWQMHDATKRFLDLDDRIFDCIVDITPHRFYEEHIEEPEQELEERSRREGRELSYAGASYYRNYDNITVSPNSSVKTRAGWRHRTR